jgi:hypothetical protein
LLKISGIQTQITTLEEYEMTKTIIVSSEEINNAQTLKEYLGKACDNSHILIDKTIIMNALVHDIIEHDEIDREKIKLVAKEMQELAKVIRGHTDNVMKFLNEHKSEIPQNIFNDKELDVINQLATKQFNHRNEGILLNIMVKTEKK